MDELVSLCGHIVFNSFAQLEKFGPKAVAAGVSVGLRVNPQCSTQEGHAIYDPCAPGSRLGITADQFDSEQARRLLPLVSGLHFHTLCEQNSDDLEKTLDAVEERFAKWLPQMKWINFGGGHHITRTDYDVPCLERCIRRMQEHWGAQIYLEPGEAVALNAGFLLTSVLDVVENEKKIAILDTSAACHMPDVLGDAVPAAVSRTRSAGGEAVYLSPGRTDLSGGGYHRRLFL